MRLTTSGRSLCGVGHGVVSVDGVVVVEGGGKPCQLNSTRFIYQRGSTLESRLIEDPAAGAVWVSDVGAHILRAGGGHWASLASSGLYVNNAHWPMSPLPGLWDVSPDGEILICPDYNTGPEAGQGIDWVDPETKTVLKSLPPHVTGPIRVDATAGPTVRSLSNGRAVWITGNEVRTTGLVSFIPLPYAMDFVVPVEAADGEVWLLERWSEARLTLRRSWSTWGYLLADGVETWAPDAIASGHGGIRVAYCQTANEAPIHVDGLLVSPKRIDVGLSGPMIDFAQPLLPPVTRVVKPYRDYAFITYTFNHLTTPVGDIVLPIRYSKSALVTLDDSGYGRVDTVDSLKAPDEPYAVYAGEDSEMSCEDAIRLARAEIGDAEIGVLAYQDSVPVRDSVLMLLEKGDAISWPNYLNHDEPVSAFKVRVGAEYERVCARLEALGRADVKAIPVVGIHKRIDADHPSGLPLDGLIGAFIACTELSDEQDWFGLNVFRQGTTDMPPEMIPYLTEFLSGVGAVAMLPTPVPDPPDPPDPPDDTYPRAKEVDMANAIVGVRGPGGKFGRVDPNDPEHIFFDREDVGPHEEVEVMPREGKPGQYALRFVAANVVINGAGDWAQGGTALPFNTRPVDKIGGHEEFFLAIQPPDDHLITAMIHYHEDGKWWTGAPLSIVEIK